MSNQQGSLIALCAALLLLWVMSLQPEYQEQENEEEQP